MKVALVHDYLTEFGGGERVLKALCELFPEAPIYTLVYKKEITEKFFPNKRIIPSFLQKIPFAKNNHRFFLSLMPYAIETLDLSRYDFVISDTASYAKGVITQPNTFHLCYCYTPTRYFWDDSQKYFRDFNLNPILKKLGKLLMPYLRIWDYQAAQRPDKIIAISDFVSKRIKKFYRRDAEVIYPPCGTHVEAGPPCRSRVEAGPPVETEKFKKENVVPRQSLGQDDYFLIVGRLIAYKHFEIAIDAFRQFGANLKIIGTGPEEKKLRKLAGNSKNIEFLGWVEDEELPKYYAGAKAFIFTQEEDFGITAVEAMAAGKPVIAYRAGGAIESVIENKTGIFFKNQNSESLLQALKVFKSSNFDPKQIQSQAENFNKEKFNEKISNLIKSLPKQGI